MNRIKIDQLRDILICEKADEESLFKDSFVYCGCCGHPIGKTKKKLKIPFKSDQFLSALKDKTVDHMIFGLRHKTCGHTMFSFSRSFNFISLSNYKKAANKETLKYTTPRKKIKVARTTPGTPCSNKH